MNNGNAKDYSSDYVNGGCIKLTDIIRSYIKLTSFDPNHLLKVAPYHASVNSCSNTVINQ